MLLMCKCSNKFQDETYGLGRRVHNETSKGWRCTVCGNEQVGKGPSVVATTATPKKAE